MTKPCPGDDEIRSGVAAELDALQVPAFSWEAVRQRASTGRARPRPWLAVALVASVLGLAATAAAATDMAGALALLGGHLRIVATLSDGVVQAVDRRGFHYTITPSIRRRRSLAAPSPFPWWAILGLGP